MRLQYSFEHCLKMKRRPSLSF